MRIKLHKLSKQEELLLSFAITTGYFSMETVQTAFPGESYNALYKRIKALVDKEYLYVFKIGGAGNSTPNVYKVTKRTTHFFGIIGSYKVKDHKEEYVIKKLIESKFVGQIFNTLSSNLLTEHHDKMEALRSFGYEDDHIPKAIGNLIYHIEEMILVNDGSVNWLEGHEFAFVIADDIYKSIDAQIKAITKKYQALATHRPCKYVFVTDDPRREKLITEHISRILIGQPLNTDNIEPMNRKNPNLDYVKLYLEYLSKNRQIQYKDLIKRLDAFEKSSNDIIVDASAYIKKNVITHTAKKEIVELVASLKFEEFISLIKKAHLEKPEMVKEYFLTAFLIQVAPDISKITTSELKKEIVEKFNFSCLKV